MTASEPSAPGNALLAGRTVLLTGAGNGMGLAMTCGLLDAGADVYAVDRDASALEQLDGSREHARGGKLRCHVVDLTDPESVAEIVPRCESVLGAVDVLVNNAGLPKFLRRDGDAAATEAPRLWQVELDELELYLGVQLLAPFLLARDVIPAMLRRGSGSIVNVTTNLHTMIGGGSGPYGPSKAGEEAMTSILADELEGTGVVANVLIPGARVATRPTRTPREDDGPALTAGVMVPPILWLASSDAARMNGRRVIASEWDVSLPPDQASEAAAAPIAWRPLLAAP